MQHRLAGNVRELRRLLRNALVHCGARIELGGTSSVTPVRHVGARGTVAGQVEEDQHPQGAAGVPAVCQGAAARVLGVSPNTLKSKMDRYRISAR